MLLSMADGWERPRFPLTGRDVMAAGVPEGPEVGRVLAAVEAWWLDEDFLPDETRAAGEAEKRDRVRRMSFELLDQLSLPGDPAKPNEDAFGASMHAAAGAGWRHAAGSIAAAGPQRRGLDRAIRRAAADGASEGWRCATRGA